MKHILFPKGARNSITEKQGESVGISLGGYFYDYLRRADGEIVGVTYWLMEPVNFENHPVYAHFHDDDRFVFDVAGGCVNIVFDESNAELLKKGQLTTDVVQEFGGESVLRCGEQFAIVFSLVD
ncbi:hypothetical protein [Polaromonas aquatica]|uniref:hypothetical protein n=1 Tax=Polaromonas aquatica TaxID=332657 RepID=UPI003D647C3E